MSTCPICKTEVVSLEPTGDAEGFDCPHHGKFKVSRTVLATEPKATRQDWEGALRRAGEKAKPGIWPTITTHDF